MKKTCLLLLMLGSVRMQPVMASSHYVIEHEKGWHWYESIEVALPPNHPVRQGELGPVSDPVATLHQQSVRLKQALSQAILMPTVSHVHAYIRLQNALIAQASRFAKMWQVTLLQHPELDYSIKHPTANYARHLQIERHNKRDEQRLHTLASHAGLLFFYRSTCPYCHRFAPIIKAFANAYHFALIPVTLDGKALPAFPHSKTDQGQAYHLKVNVVPAVFLYDIHTKKISVVSYGAISADALKERVLHAH